jgi:hypothetical protein
MAKKMFGGNIQPACEYCEHGTPSVDSNMVLCKKRGVVSPLYSCRKFKYTPLKRKPLSKPQLPVFSPEDFEL